MQDLIVISIMAVLRVGIPAAVILGVGYLLLRYSKSRISADIQAPAEAAGLGPAEWAKAVTVPPANPCWEEKNCDPVKRSSCAAFKRAHVPCWLAVQVAEGQLRAECIDCEMYRLEKRQAPYLRVIKGRKPEKEEAACGEAACKEASASAKGTGTA